MLPSPAHRREDSCEGQPVKPLQNGPGGVPARKLEPDEESFVAHSLAIHHLAAYRDFPFVGITSACSPIRHALIDFTRMPCELILSVKVLSPRSTFARPTGARVTSIMIGSLLSSLPLR